MEWAPVVEEDGNAVIAWNEAEAVLRITFAGGHYIDLHKGARIAVDDDGHAHVHGAVFKHPTDAPGSYPASCMPCTLSLSGTASA